MISSRNGFGSMGAMFLLLLVVFGCTNDPAFQRPKNFPKMRTPPYEWSFYNPPEYGTILKAIGFTWRIKSGGVASESGGTLMPGSGASDNQGWDPIPDRVTIQWSEGPLDSHENRKSEIVEVATAIPDLEHFTGTIWFKYNGHGWDIIPLTTTETARRLKAKQAIP